MNGGIKAAVSAKTVALATLQGRALRFQLSPDWSYTGWLCGFDEFHWRVATHGHDGPEVHLIHKSQAVVTVLPGPILADLADAEVERIVGPFRQAMAEKYGPSTGS